MLGEKQSGRSMVEMLGVLAIVAVLAVGIIAIYNMAMGRMRTNQTIDLVQTLVYDLRTANMVRGHYYGTGKGETVSNYNDYQAYLAKKKVIPRSLCSGNKAGGVDEECKTLSHPLGGELRISPTEEGKAQAGTDDPDASKQTVSITLLNLNRAACIYIATADWSTGGGTSDTIQSMKVGDSANEITEYPADISDVAADCVGKDKSIVFTLRSLKISK